MFPDNRKLAEHLIRLSDGTFDAARVIGDVETLERLAIKAHRFALQGTNGPEPTKVQVEDDLTNDRLIMDRCAPYLKAGIITKVEVGGDPRGYVVLVHLKDRHLTNSFGGEGWGIHVRANQ